MHLTRTFNLLGFHAGYALCCRRREVEENLQVSNSRQRFFYQTPEAMTGTYSIRFAKVPLR